MDLLWRLRRYFRSRRPLRPRTRRGGRSGAAPVRARWRRPRPWQVTLLVGILLAAAVIGFLEARLRPMVVTAAQAQAQNTVAGVIEHAIWEQLGEEAVTYSDLVTIQRDSAGTITALTTNTAAMNQLRAELIGVVLEALDGVDVSQIQIPLGSLVDLDGEFQSQFSSAGVNQTLHKIDLELAVPLTLMLPGRAVEAVCETQIPIAETVIVGQVPQIFLQNGGF